MNHSIQSMALINMVPKQNVFKIGSDLLIYSERTLRKTRMENEVGRNTVKKNNLTYNPSKW